MDKRVIQIICLIGIFCASSRSGFPAEKTYQSPNFAAGVSDIGEISLASDYRLGSSLVAYAASMKGYPEIRAKALALAWHCDGKNDYLARSLIKVDFSLRLGKALENRGLAREEVSDRQYLSYVEKIETCAREIAGSGEKSKVALAAYLYDILLAERVPEEIRKKAESALKTLGEPSWSGVLGDVSLLSWRKSKGKMVTASTILADGKFKQRQSLIKGLLVVDLGGSEYAGQASQMNATLVAGSGAGSPTEITFNQEVGDSMKAALSEVHKFLSIRHDGLPPGNKVEIAFEEQYSSKDGPSAAVACSLLIDSLITGDKFDTGFAVTGDMNADGSVQPVGGIDGKIRGATKRNCTHVAIPRVNIGLLSDMIVIDDLKPLIQIQVFSIGKFEEALALAQSPESRDPKLQEAMTTFAEVQKVLLRPNGLKYLSGAAVKNRLRKVISAAPNHESARQLLAKGNGNVPGQLSLRGSFTQIDRVTRPIMNVLKTGVRDNSMNGLKDSIFALRRVRRKLDDRAKPTADSLEDLSEKLEMLANSKLTPRDSGYQVLIRKFEESLSRVQTEYNKLASNPDIQEELIK